MRNLVQGMESAKEFNSHDNRKERGCKWVILSKHGDFYSLPVPI
jgi:hypothetical protein